jgi:hypothetical protein
MARGASSRIAAMINGKSLSGNGHDRAHSFDALATRARSVPIEDELARRGIRLRGKNDSLRSLPEVRRK